MSTLDDWVTGPALQKEYPDKFNSWTLKSLSMNRDSNGLAQAGAVKKLRGRIWFNRKKMADWWENQSD